MSKTFKLFFNENDIRRVTKEVMNFESFVKFLEELYPQYHCELLIKYDDSEGDRIAVTSQMEWEEMLEELQDEKVIKLYITEGPNPRGYFKDGPKPEPLHYYNDNVSKEPISIDSIKNLNENVVKCLESLFRDGKIIPTNMPGFLKEVVGVKFLPENTVDLDIDIPRLAEKLHRISLDCLASLDKEVIQKGKDYLLALLGLNPCNVVALYNLACAESLLNHVPEALLTLERAIKMGYHDLEHMLEDKDFDNIRNCDEFIKLVNLMNDMDGGEFTYEDDCGNHENENCCKENEKCCKENEKCCQENTCNGCEDEPVVLEYDGFQNSVQFNEEPEPQKQVKTDQPKIEKQPETKVEQLNNQLSESFIDLRSKWTQKIDSIKSLGFVVDDEVLSLLLEQTSGNVEEVVNLLMQNQ